MISSYQTVSAYQSTATYISANSTFLTTTISPRFFYPGDNTPPSSHEAIPEWPLWGEPDHHGHPLCPPTSWFTEHDVPRVLRARAPALPIRAAAVRTLHRNAGDRRRSQALVRAIVARG